jgi:NADH-quinone oxidoreductase subunit A
LQNSQDENDEYSIYDETMSWNGSDIYQENSVNDLNLILREINLDKASIISDVYTMEKSKIVSELKNSDNGLLESISLFKDNHYLWVAPNWESAVSRISQISAIGDILYSVYHSYIYIVSVILLLGMIGAIILTAENTQEVRVLTIQNTKKSGLFIPKIKFNQWLKYIILKLKGYFNFKYNSKMNMVGIPSFFYVSPVEMQHSEDIIGSLFYFIIANIIIGLLLLFINSYFSLSVKYLEKGGGFECGFTSFLQTRERFNVIFYRVSLLFLIFDLEIILIFPFPAIYQKSESMSKNNVLAFLYILVVGFIYELKEGALNIVKKVHLTEVNIIDE